MMRPDANIPVLNGTAPHLYHIAAYPALSIRHADSQPVRHPKFPIPANPLQINPLLRTHKLALLSPSASPDLASVNPNPQCVRHPKSPTPANPLKPSPFPDRKSTRL